MKHPKKQIIILLLGGTAACVLGSDQKSITVDLSDYIKTFHEFDDCAQIRTRLFRSLKGYEMTISDVIDTANEIKKILREETVDGIVVVMGTNVMEEASFALNLLIQTEIPIVVTGAMRIPEARSADGPANLAAAVSTALSDHMRNTGVVVVFNDTIHSADYIRKQHSLNLHAITSEFPLGYVAEGSVSLRTRPIRRIMPWLNPVTSPKDVLLYTSCLGDTGKVLDQINTLNYEGLVVEGTGGGNLPEWVFDKIEKLHTSMPICIASRTGAGDLMTETYGAGYGRPRYLVEHRYLLSGQLDGRKARILLMLLLMSNCDTDTMNKSFHMYAKENSPME